MIQGVFTDIIASLVLILLGYLIQQGQTWVKLQPFRRLWKPFLSDRELFVIMTTRSGPHSRSTPRISWFEMSGFISIQDLLGRFRVDAIPTPSYPFSDISPMEKLKSSNVILLGSPTANDIATEVWSKFKDQLPYVYDASNQQIVVGERKYIPEEYEPGKVVRDYGLIIRRPNPYHSEKMIMILAGCHGFSTYGASKIVTTKKFVKTLSQATGNRDFVALVEIERKDHSVLSFKLLECFLFTEIIGTTRVN